MPEWTVSLPERLDVFLGSEGRALSRNRAQKNIESGMVSVNDEVVTKVSYRLQEGDKVSLREDEAAPTSTQIEPVDFSLSVLYEDDSCMVIDKPAGIAVHPGAGMAPQEKTVLHGIVFLFQKRAIPFSPEAVLVHRLDRDTTGCLLIAKNPAAHLELQKQFETRTVRKQYLALVAGIPKHDAAMIDSPIGRSATDRTMMSVRGVGSVREAQTTYRVLESAGNASLLLCDLHTGRTHQVRVHLQSIGHPVLGDGTYTTPGSERLSQEIDIRSLCLHAWKLSFISPADKSEHAVTAPLPVSFARAIGQAGMEWKE